MNKPLQKRINVDVSKKKFIKRTSTTLLTPVDFHVMDEEFKSLLEEQDNLAIMLKKAKLPLTFLPSFNVTALILSYIGFADEVNALILQLSWLTRKYSKGHREILDGFLIKWEP